MSVRPVLTPRTDNGPRSNRNSRLLHQRNELAFTSTLLPGGNLVAAIMDRVLMRLSDRGGASGLIGDRWASLCAESLAGWIGGPTGQRGHNGATVQIERVIRLDELPHIACAASRQKLQSPDFVILGRVHGEPVVQAADAKFSVETARSRQVSAQVLADLFTHLPDVRAMLSDGWTAAELVPGMFLCPDYPLTTYMLRGQRGLRRVTVHPHEVALLPVVAQQFVAPMPAASLIPLLHESDQLAIDPAVSLLASLYYYRLVRACVTCAIDETRPLLGHQDPVAPDLEVIREGVLRHMPAARSAYGLVMAWQRDAARVQEDRDRVERAAAMPLHGRDLRAMIAALCGDENAPSLNQVRRKLAGWYHAQLLDLVGPIYPPVSDLEPVLHTLRAAAASLRHATVEEATRIIVALQEERVATGVVEAPVTG